METLFFVPSSTKWWKELFVSFGERAFFSSKRSRKCAFDFHLEITFRKLRTERRCFGSFCRALSLSPVDRGNCLHSIWTSIDVISKQREKGTKIGRTANFPSLRKRRLESGTRQILSMRGAQTCFPFIISPKFFIVIRLYTTFCFSFRLVIPNQMKFYIVFVLPPCSGE